MRGFDYRAALRCVSTHSRPKAAGFASAFNKGSRISFNTQPPEGGWYSRLFPSHELRMFQHTAARRRLAPPPPEVEPLGLVSTHSRPKAAGAYDRLAIILKTRFNTQPPEGGWVSALNSRHVMRVSTHSRPKAAG